MRCRPRVGDAGAQAIADALPQCCPALRLVSLAGNDGTALLKRETTREPNVSTNESGAPPAS
eukprot:4168802-Amphidinium_carterae.2